MSLRTPLRSILLALAVTTAAGAAFAGPAAAKSRNYQEHPIYNDRQNWYYVDQDQDGHVSKSEWKKAEKRGYDRLNGVPKKSLTRKEYQSYFDAYLAYRQQRGWRQADYRDRQREDERRNDEWRNYYQGRYDQGGYDRGQYDQGRHRNDEPLPYNPNGGGGKR